MIALAMLALSAILGQPLPDWPPKPADRWVQGGPVRLADLRGTVVLIRFFTGTDCPHCGRTAPALEELHREFGRQGLVVIGMYTPKPRPRPVNVDEVRQHVRSYGFTFPVAIDDDWGALRRLWLDRVPGAGFTSASLLVDRRGVVRHVHEGGTFAKEGAGAQARRDYDAMRSAVRRLIAEGRADVSTVFDRDFVDDLPR